MDVYPPTWATLGAMSPHSIAPLYDHHRENRGVRGVCGLGTDAYPSNAMALNYTAATGQQMAQLPRGVSSAYEPRCCRELRSSGGA